MSSFIDSRLRPFGISFEKTLKDLITGIRSNSSNPEDLQNFFAKVVQECKEEVKLTDMTKKSNAILKLSYLEMYGFDISWSSFYVLEVMSSNSFQQKRVGYLAAQQVFHNDPSILMLATNCLKKDLNSMHAMEIGIALNGISSIITPSLARDISKDLFKMLRHGKAYIRKKAVAALFKLFLQYPEALRDDFQLFMDKLHDEDTSVVSVVISVICELCKINSEPFMQFLPLFYDMLVDIKNNWITIRLLKLFTTFSRKEPKLKNRLLPKILELISKTDAKSLIYESINCIVRGKMLDSEDYDVAAQLLEHLAIFCDSRDPNLRYVSCVLFYHIGKINALFIESFDALIFKLLTDVDITIRSKAIELLGSVINEENLMEVTGILLKQVVVNEEKFVSRISGKEERIEISNDYKIKVMHFLLYLFQKNDYENISMFEWYITVLSDLSHIAINIDLGDECDLGVEIGEHFRNIAVKVPEMRDQVVVALIKLVSNNDIYTQVPQVLSESFWCLGEYSSIISNCDDLIKLMLTSKRKLLTMLPPTVLKNIFPCLMKLFNNWINNNLQQNIDKKSVADVCDQLIEFFELFIKSSEIEIQERSVEQLEFFKILKEALDICDNEEAESAELPMLATKILPSFFNSWEIQPVQHGQQMKLQNRLDLSWLDDEIFMSEEMVQDLEQKMDDLDPHEDELTSSEEEENISSSDDDNDNGYTPGKYEEEMSEEELKQMRENLRRERLENPFYLNDDAVNDKDLLELDTDEITSNKDGNTEDNVTIRVQHTLNTDPVSQKKSKSKKKPRVKIISDSTLDLGDDAIPHHESSSASLRRSIPTRGGTRGGDKIDLTFQNKLKGFDFSKGTSSSSGMVGGGDDEYMEDHNLESTPDIDLDQLRNEFDLKSNVVIHSGGTASGLNDEDEEIIVIKKKKKKSKKSKADSGDGSEKKKKKKKSISKPVELLEED